MVSFSDQATEKFDNREPMWHTLRKFKRVWAFLA